MFMHLCRISESFINERMLEVMIEIDQHQSFSLPSQLLSLPLLFLIFIIIIIIIIITSKGTCSSNRKKVDLGSRSRSKSI